MYYKVTFIDNIRYTNKVPITEFANPTNWVVKILKVQVIKNIPDDVIEHTWNKTFSVYYRKVI